MTQLEYKQNLYWIYPLPYNRLAVASRTWRGKPHALLPKEAASMEMPTEALERLPGGSGLLPSNPSCSHKSEYNEKARWRCAPTDCLANRRRMARKAIMKWQAEYRKKTVRPTEAVQCIRSTKQVYIHSRCAEPETRVKALIELAHPKFQNGLYAYCEKTRWLQRPALQER